MHFDARVSYWLCLVTAGRRTCARWQRTSTMCTYTCRKSAWLFSLCRNVPSCPVPDFCLGIFHLVFVFHFSPLTFNWEGGCALAKDSSLKRLLVSRSQYEENGHSICADKFDIWKPHTGCETAKPNLPHVFAFAHRPTPNVTETGWMWATWTFTNFTDATVDVWEASWSQTTGPHSGSYSSFLFVKRFADQITLGRPTGLCGCGMWQTDQMTDEMVNILYFCTKYTAVIPHDTSRFALEDPEVECVWRAAPRAEWSCGLSVRTGMNWVPTHWTNKIRNTVPVQRLVLLCQLQQSWTTRLVTTTSIWLHHWCAFGCVGGWSLFCRFCLVHVKDTTWQTDELRMVQRKKEIVWWRRANIHKAHSKKKTNNAQHRWCVQSLKLSKGYIDVHSSWSCKVEDNSKSNCDRHVVNRAEDVNVFEEPEPIKASCGATHVVHKFSQIFVCRLSRFCRIVPEKRHCNTIKTATCAPKLHHLQGVVPVNEFKQEQHFVARDISWCYQTRPTLKTRARSNHPFTSCWLSSSKWSRASRSCCSRTWSILSNIESRPEPRQVTEKNRLRIRGVHQKQ